MSSYDYYLPHTLGALLGILIIFIIVSYIFPPFQSYKSRIAMNQSPKSQGASAASGPTLQRSAPGATLATASDGAATEQSSPERHGALLR